MPKCCNAETAGAFTTSHRYLQKVILRRNATSTPRRARRIRVLSSSRCSIKDMRSMPFSSSPALLSSSSSGGDGGAGGGVLRAGISTETASCPLEVGCSLFAAWGKVVVLEVESESEPYGSELI